MPRRPFHSRASPPEIPSRPPKPRTSDPAPMLPRPVTRFPGFRVGLLACLAFGQPGTALLADPPPSPYRPWAEETLASMDTEFWLPARHLYADKGRPHQPPAPPVTMMWGVGVALSALDAAARLDPDHYRDRLTAYIDALNVYWTNFNGIGGYDVLPGPKPNDRFYDDNAWMVLALAEADEITHRPGDLARAEAAYQFVLSGEDDQLGGGIYWHEPKRESKNTCSNAPAIVGALRLFQLTRKPAYLADARRLYQWTCAHLQGADGLFADHVKLDGQVDNNRFSYNSGLMIRAASLLHRATGEAAYLANAQRIAHAAEARWIAADTGAVRDEGKFAHLLLEGFLALHDEDHDPHWLAVENRALRFLHAQVRNADGQYGKRWDRGPDAAQTIFSLIDQASAARAYWVGAALPP